MKLYNRKRKERWGRPRGNPATNRNVYIGMLTTAELGAWIKNEGKKAGSINEFLNRTLHQAKQLQDKPISGQ